MGGHGGLNILPQKRWNVYNFDNREKVRKDEEAAAKEEQLKREQSRKRDAEFRLALLRRSRGISSPPRRRSPSPSPADSRHINLFQGLQGFSALGEEKDRAEAPKEERSGKRKREERPTVPVIAPEDEKYRMGYGVAGKGVKAPWYLAKPVGAPVVGEEEGVEERKEKSKGSGKKTIDELREERAKREKREKERERALVASAGRERHKSSFENGRARGSRFG